MAASSVLIGTHLNPDGDAPREAALAMSHYLDGAADIQTRSFAITWLPRTFSFLPGVNPRQASLPSQEKYDLGIVLDLDSLERLGNAEQFLHRLQYGESSSIITFPHEAPGQIFGSSTLSAPATAVILTRLLLLPWRDHYPRGSRRASSPAS